MIIYGKQIISTDLERLTSKEIADTIKQYEQSERYMELKQYSRYYNGENAEIHRRYHDKYWRNVKPNNLVPTAYYQTITNTIAGYMFADIDYDCEDENYKAEIDRIMFENNNAIKDMTAGARAIAYNKAAEIVYTTGDNTKIDVRFAPVDPLCLIPIYDDSIEPEIFCAIRYYKVDIDSDVYQVDVIYKDLWQKWEVEKDKAVHKPDFDKLLLFDYVPVVIYRTEMFSSASQLDCIIPYIDALDVLMSGNSNEIDRLVDALLAIGKVLKDEDLEHMEEWRVLEGLKKDDRAEYITKQMSSDFRKYVSDLLISEIYKHSHVPNWHDMNFGGGDASAKALRTRLFDMHMMANKSEMVFREGLERRLLLIQNFLEINKSMQYQPVKIEIERLIPSEFEDKALILNQLTFISDQTKAETLGFDWEIEKERLDEQAPEPFDMASSFPVSQDDTTEPMDDTEQQ